jgi:hypothetical protein
LGAWEDVMDFRTGRRRALAATLCSMGLAFGAAGASAADVLSTYPVPPALLYSAHNDDFTVRVRTPGGEWRDLYEFRIQVDTDTKQYASMAIENLRIGGQRITAPKAGDIAVSGEVVGLEVR